MATKILSYSFPSDTQGWTYTYGGTGAQPSGLLTNWSSNGNPSGSGSLETYQVYGTAPAPGSWGIGGTWQSLGIPSGSTITGIQLANLDRIVYSNGSQYIEIGPVTVAGSGSTVTLWSGVTLTTAYSVWVSEGGSAMSVPSAMQASSSPVAFSVGITIGNSSSTTHDGLIYLDNIEFIVTYTGGAVGSTYSGVGQSDGWAIGLKSKQALYNVYAETAGTIYSGAIQRATATAIGSANAYALTGTARVFRALGGSLGTIYSGAVARSTFAGHGDSSGLASGTPYGSIFVGNADALGDAIGGKIVGTSFSAQSLAVTSFAGSFSGVPSLPAGQSYFTGVGSTNASATNVNRVTSTYTAIGNATGTPSGAATVPPNPRKAGGGCGCCTSPPPPPTQGPCNFQVNVTACQAFFTTYNTYPEPGCYNVPYPLSQNNLNIGATVTLTTVSGLNLTAYTQAGTMRSPANVALFSIPSSYSGQMITGTVTAPGYHPATFTHSFVCPDNGMNFQGSPFNLIAVNLCPTQQQIFFEIVRCDTLNGSSRLNLYPGACSVEDSSGSSVQISGFGGSAFPQNGTVTITGPSPDCGQTVKTTCTVTAPQPYYQNVTGVYTITPSCVNNVGGWEWFYGGSDIGVESNICSTPLSPGYNCYASVVQQGSYDYDGNLLLHNVPAICKSRPYPTILHGNIDGSPIVLTDDGTGVFGGSAMINGLCCQLTLDANCTGYGLQVSLQSQFVMGEYDSNNVYNVLNPGIVLWKPPYCAQANPYPAPPTLTLSNCGGCPPGNSLIFGARGVRVGDQFISAVQLYFFLPLQDTAGPGYLPLNAKGTGEIVWAGGTGVSGSPFAWQALVTE